MSKSGSFAAIFRRGLSLGLAAAGLWLGTAMAEDALLALVEAENGTLLGRARINGAVVTGLERDGDGVQGRHAGLYPLLFRQRQAGFLRRIRRLLGGHGVKAAG